MWMKSFTHMSCQSSRLSGTIPVRLQYGKELFASHTPLTGLPAPDPSPIGHPWDILGRLVHDGIPS